MNDSVPDADIDAAVVALKQGLLVAMPTETVYGLAANARNPAAVARLYAAKGRPADHPVIVHIASAAGLSRWARTVPDAAWTLAARYWPGPLTMVLPRAMGVRDAITGGQDTVAIRCPAHPVALRLLSKALTADIDGLVAPSANRFGRVSPTTAAHVRDELGGAVEVVLDGGPCAIGIESTIVDLSGIAPRVLRPGMIGEDELAACLGVPLAEPDAGAPRVSGALPAHYAPRTPLELAQSTDCAARVGGLAAKGERIAVLASTSVLMALAEYPSVVGLAAAETPAAYARALYGSLRELDAARCERIVIESPPATAPWRGIVDRLTRAAR